MSKNQKVIVDVRTRGEFESGNVRGSINIPLNEIPERISEIKNLGTPLVLCCASGMRSQQATSFLKSNGINCENGGSWLDLDN